MATILAVTKLKMLTYILGVEQPQHPVFSISLIAQILWN